MSKAVSNNNQTVTHATQNRILVLGPAWVGDMVMAHSLIQMLSLESDTIIDVAAPAWSAKIASRMKEVSNVIPMNLPHGKFNLKLRYEIAQQLKKNNYTHAYVLQNNWKSALIPFFANIPKRIGFLGEYRWGLLTDTLYGRKKIKRTVDQYRALGTTNKIQIKPELKPMPKLEADTQQAYALAEQFNVTLSKPLLALCPGAEYGPSKQWPADYFIELAKAAMENGWQVCLLGSKKDKIVAALIQNAVPNLINVVGKTDLLEAIDLLSLAKTVVSNDSGLMHIASALNKKVIAIYGATHSDVAPPLTTQGHILEINNLACRPCKKRVCPLGHHDCMRGIRPEEVLAAL